MHLAVICGAVVLLSAAVILIEGLTGIAFFTSPSSGFVPMAPFTSALFVLLGGTILALARRDGFARAAGIVPPLMIFLSCLALALFCARLGFGSENAFERKIDIFGSALDGMSPLTALLFLLLASHAMVIPAPRFRRFGEILSGVVGAVAIVLVIGYWYGVPLLYGGSIVPVALSTAILFLLSAIALLAVDARSALVRLATSNAVHVRFFRGVAPVAIVFVLIEGWLVTRAIGMASGQYSVLFSAICSLCLALSIAAIATLVGRKEEARIRAAEEALRKNEHWLAESQRLAHIGSWFFRTPVSVSWSEEMYRIYGVSEDSFTPTAESVVGLIHPDDRPSVYSWIDACLAGKKPDALEQRIILSDGTVRHVLTSGDAVSDADGSLIHLAGTAQDITERKLAEESKTRLATAVEQSAETVLITDADSTILYINPAFVKISGYTREEVIGRNSRILKSGEHDEEFYQRMWAALTAGEIWIGKIVNKKKDGTLYELSGSISPVRNVAGTIINYVAVRRDISRETHLEAQLLQAQKMEAVGQLAGGVAHDFNNLLSVILGSTEVLADELHSSDPRRTLVSEIRSATESAAALTRQLLAFGRKQMLAPKTIRLCNVVRGVEKMLLRLLPENIEILIVGCPDYLWVHADPAQMEQIIMNLAVNARDAMPSGGKLTIELSHITLDETYADFHFNVKPGDYVCLTVSDTGTGMDDQTQARIFEPFFTTKESGKGTGLGLATVYGIVMQSAGYITVYSEQGRGSAFKICLPRVEAPVSAPSPAPKPARAASTKTGGSILLVEDNAGVRRAARRNLEHGGYRVIEAADGNEAIQIAESGTIIDLVMTDVVMPNLGGPELAIRLRKNFPELRVLFMSGYTEAGVQRQGLIEGAFDFIEKPFSREILLEKLREIFERGTP